MKQVYQYKSLPTTFKDADMKSGIVSGYFSAFNVTDAYNDIMMPGAFAKTISEQGPKSKQPRIKHLLNHDVNSPLGKLTELAEDGYGLAYTSQIGGHDLGQDFIKMVESGLVTEHSIGFITVKNTYNNESKINQIHEVKLYEGSSLTGWGVNQYTPMTGLKSLEDAEARLKRLETFCRNTDATDETIEMLLLEVRQLTQAIADIKATPAAVEAQEPVEEVKKLDAGLILTYLSL